MDKLINEVLANPNYSTWLKNAIRSSLQRDPVDAANDARLLAKLMANNEANCLAEYKQLTGVAR